MGASNLWKKTVEETLTFGWTAFSSLRSSFSEGLCVFLATTLALTIS